MAVRPQEQEVSSDPDNIPPRSRLFLVVPKQADPQAINVRAGGGEAGAPLAVPWAGRSSPARLLRPPLAPQQDSLAAYDGLEYCKTDLVAAKGVVFCKFTRASAALRALEDVTARGMVRLLAGCRGLSGCPAAHACCCGTLLLSSFPYTAWPSQAPFAVGCCWPALSVSPVQVAKYKVKCMLAEPKTKRGRSEGSPQDAFSPMMQVNGSLLPPVCRALLHHHGSTPSLSCDGDLRSTCAAGTAHLKHPTPVCVPSFPHLCRLPSLTTAWRTTCPQQTPRTCRWTCPSAMVRPP